MDKYNNVKNIFFSTDVRNSSLDGKINGELMAIGSIDLSKSREDIN